MRCDYPVDEESGLALVGQKLVDALKEGNCVRCACELAKGDLFCPCCGRKIENIGRSPAGKIFAGVAAIVLIGAVFVGYHLYLSVTKDPFAGYEIDQILTGSEIHAMERTARRKFPDRCGLWSRCDDFFRSPRDGWEIESFNFYNSRWDSGYEGKIQLTSRGRIVTVGVTREFNSDYKSAEKEYGRVLKWFEARSGKAVVSEFRGERATAVFEHFPECPVIVKLCDLARDWRVEIELQGRGYSNEADELCRWRRILVSPGTLVENVMSWNMFYAEYVKCEKEIVASINSYLENKVNGRWNANSVLLEKCRGALRKAIRACDDAKSIDSGELGRLELDYYRKMMVLLRTFVDNRIAKSGDVADEIMDIHALRREFLRARKACLESRKDRPAVKNEDEGVIDDDEADSILQKSIEAFEDCDIAERERMNLILTNIAILAERNYVPAQYFLGATYVAPKYLLLDPKQGVQWLRRAAESGHRRACVELGKCYFTGNGVVRDVNQAYSWLKKGYSDDDGVVCYYLGECYNSGLGCEEDKDMAEQYYKRAVPLLRPLGEAGDNDVCMILANCYNCGKGVECDMEEGMRWVQHMVKPMKDKLAKAVNGFDAINESNLKVPLDAIGGVMVGEVLPDDADTVQEECGYLSAPLVADGVFAGFDECTCQALPRSRKIAVIQIAKSLKDDDVALSEYDSMCSRLNERYGFCLGQPKGFSPSERRGFKILDDRCAYIERNSARPICVDVKFMKNDDSCVVYVVIIDLEAVDELERGR